MNQTEAVDKQLFRFIEHSALGLPPHWESIEGKYVVVIPSNTENKFWRVWDPVRQRGAPSMFVGEDAEARAFAIANTHLTSTL